MDAEPAILKGGPQDGALIWVVHSPLVVNIPALLEMEVRDFIEGEDVEPIVALRVDHFYHRTGEWEPVGQPCGSLHACVYLHEALWRA